MLTQAELEHLKWLVGIAPDNTIAKIELGKAIAEIDRLLVLFNYLQDVLGDAIDLDPEHTIQCHDEDLCDGYLRTNRALERGRNIVAEALGSDKLG